MNSQNRSIPRVLGISGGIGSGKSVFSRLLSFFDIPVFDSDKEAKLLYEEEEVKDFVCSHFGKELYNTSDGVIDRKAFAKILFSDPKALSLLEGFIHPLVKEHFNEWKRAQNKTWVALESAILFPCGWDSLCDAIVWIEAPIEERITRIALRDKVSTEDIMQRLKAQENILPQPSQRCFFRVNNSMGTPLLPQIRNILEQLNLSR